MKRLKSYAESDLESLQRIANTERLAGDYVLAQKIEPGLLKCANLFGRLQVCPSEFGKPGGSRVTGATSV